MPSGSKSANPAVIEMKEEGDIFRARKCLKDILNSGFFGEREEVCLYTIASELTRNIVKYAGEGACEFLLLRHAGRTRIRCTCRDKGPGIPDIEAALSDGYSTGSTLGIGLPGVKRLADSFQIDTSDEGTIVEAEVLARDKVQGGRHE